MGAMGGRVIMNESLFKYGIEEEQSDIRAHVSLRGRCVTVFRTADMLALVKAKKYPEKPATQPGVNGSVTAKGYIVPLADIEPKYILCSSKFPWDRYDHDKMTLMERGDAAVAVVRAAIRANYFPLWVCGIVESDKELDIQGTDIVVNARRRIQVKYDHAACSAKDGGTGNLFIQTHERNPLKIYSSAPLQNGKPDSGSA